MSALEKELSPLKSTPQIPFVWLKALSMLSGASEYEQKTPQSQTTNQPTPP